MHHSTVESLKTLRGGGGGGGGGVKMFQGATDVSLQQCTVEPL